MNKIITLVVSKVYIRPLLSILVWLFSFQSINKDNLHEKDRAREGVECVVVDEGEERGGEEWHRRLKARHHREDLAKLGLNHHLQFECALLLDAFVNSFSIGDFF